jgi:hypothetical protein
MKKRILLVLGLTLAAAAVFAQSQTKPTKLSFEYRYNLAADEPEKNFFSWTLERTGANGAVEKRSVKDTLDPTRTTVPASHVDTQTGASAIGATAEFGDAMNLNGKSIFPSALRGLMLYAVSPRSYAVNEDLRVEQQGKKLTIYWTHNANSNMLWTNDKGEIELDNCMASLATCDRPTPETIQVKPEYLKGGADDTKKTSIDWTKVVPAMNKGGPTSTDFKYTGKVTTAYKNGILTIKGSLTLQPK